jgi:hypothetical protein
MPVYSANGESAKGELTPCFVVESCAEPETGNVMVNSVPRPT